MEDSRQQSPEPESSETLLTFPTTAAAAVGMGFLNPKKRKHIGVVQSLKAIAMSSCVFLISSRGRTHSSDDFIHNSVECVCHIHTPCMGISFCEAFERYTWIDVFSYVSSYYLVGCTFLTSSPVSFLALVPLEHFFDWGGEQVALYCGRDLGDLIIITLNK